ncbi:MAG: Gfo/Idh/MocA family protein, partial [Pseudomonadota bacterium]
MNTPVKVAVIGAGFMGSMHASIFAQSPGAELVAVVDQNLDLARAAAGKHPGCRAYRSHDELLASEQLDLISICTPDNLHRDAAIAAAAKGVHLFIEKPIASTIEDGEAIVAAAEKA